MNNWDSANKFPTLFGSLHLTLAPKNSLLQIIFTLQNGGAKSLAKNYTLGNFFVRTNLANSASLKQIR